jgi:hypothetical protein
MAVNGSRHGALQHADVVLRRDAADSSGSGQLALPVSGAGREAAGSLYGFVRTLLFAQVLETDVSGELAVGWRDCGLRRTGSNRWRRVGRRTGRR